MKTKLSSAAMLEKLVGFDTTSSGSNLGLIHFVRDYLDGFGVASELIYDAGKGKANLYATIGPKDRAGVMLSGHTDVVPVTDQAWDSDPFALREHDGLFYGRGTSDMKGFIAVALAKVPEMTAAALDQPVHFALSYDEEVGCLGAHGIAEHIRNAPFARPRLCVVGEPTGMKAITGHKGICDYDCHVHGLECHSSLAPYGVNAVEYAAELVAFIKSLARRTAREGPFNRHFDPPHTTIHTGMMSGGTAVNIVPHKCNFTFEIRTIPGHDPDTIVAEISEFAWKKLEPMMKEIEPKTGIRLVKSVQVPAFDIANDDPAVASVMSWSGANAAEKVSFGTEAGIFQQAGVPTVVCGPGHIAQAHKPNEFIAAEQLTKCELFLDRMISQLRRAVA